MNRKKMTMVMMTTMMKLEGRYKWKGCQDTRLAPYLACAYLHIEKNRMVTTTTMMIKLAQFERAENTHLTPQLARGQVERMCSCNGHDTTLTSPLLCSFLITHTHTHTHTLSLSLSLTHTNTHTLSLSLSLTHTHTHTHIHTHTPRPPFTRTYLQQLQQTSARGAHAPGHDDGHEEGGIHPCRVATQTQLLATQERAQRCTRRHRRAVRGTYGTDGTSCGRCSCSRGGGGDRFAMWWWW